MKKIIITLILAIAILPLSAQHAWKVDQVPNTRLQSDYIHVSDPDDYLSDEAEMYINTIMSAIRDSVDVFLVCLNSIGYDEPQAFRTELFNKWGIGDKGKDNGLLLLFVEDQHACEFETGYGIEPIMPDVKCFEIFQHTIKPLFKEGDYEGGMIAGVNDIFNVFGGVKPEVMITTLPDKAVYEQAIEERDKEIMSSFYVWFMIFFILIPIISFFYFLSTRSYEKKNKVNADGKFEDTYTRKTKDGVDYIYDPTSSWSGSAWEGKGCSRSVNFGLSAIIWWAAMYIVMFVLMEGEDVKVIRNYIAVATIIGYLSYVCIKQNRQILKMANKVAKDSMFPKQVYEKAKNYRRTKFFNFLAPWVGYFYKQKFNTLIAKSPEMRCVECGADMTRDEAMQPTELMACEEKLEVRKYVSAHCPNGHVFMVGNKGKNFSKYTDCSKCGAHTMKKTDTKVVVKPTYQGKGLDEITYVCQFCGAMFKKQVETPKLVHTTSTSSSGSSRSYGSSSRSSGGSFGGGRSGGGGYSGRW